MIDVVVLDISRRRDISETNEVAGLEVADGGGSFQVNNRGGYTNTCLSMVLPFTLGFCDGVVAGSQNSVLRCFFTPTCTTSSCCDVLRAMSSEPRPRSGVHSIASLFGSLPSAVATSPLWASTSRRLPSVLAPILPLLLEESRGTPHRTLPIPVARICALPVGEQDILQGHNECDRVV